MMAHHRSSHDATPICRCRVLYLGSAVPHITKDGLQGIQEPLRELYPEQGALGARGIDSWLSVWSNGVLLENVDENHKKVTRFFPIDTLHYCAAVRYVLVPEKSPASSSSQPRFLPLDSPFARSPNPNHPPLFACILRRTTGIKVLECHTFICKREMAANALVRCCFHAYADSSYAARQSDPPSTYNSNGGTYGTLRKDCQIGNSSNSIEKVDGWRRMTSPLAGSTLTLDSVVHNSTFESNGNNANGNTSASLVFNNDFSRSNDDISVYNGDENHKIWAGSTRELSDGEEGIYGEYGTSTMKSARSSRPRQIMSATPPPPPPTKEEKQTVNKTNKESSRRKKMTGGSKEEMYPLMNGSLMRPGSTVRSQGSTVGGTLMRNHGGYHSHQQQPPPMIVVPATIPHLRRGPPPKGRPHPHGPPMVSPNFYPPPPAPIFVQTTGKKNKHYPVTMEEPIYMPSNRPMSPVSSYQPCHFPIEAYLMQHYATMNYNYGRKGKKGNKKAMKMIPIMPPPPPNCEEWGDPGMVYEQRPMKEMKNGKPPSSKGQNPGGVGPGSEEECSESPFDARLYNKEGKEGENFKKGTSLMGLDEDAESPYNTGIYRRKGHMNERAFSYSIRQEHRSRSYGSLANLKFAPLPVLPGDRPDAHYYDTGVNKEEMKKEREIMQMMQDLELSGDDIERSEVPPNVYQQTRQRNSQIRR
ncbi:uncharacterized protein LOC106661175 [Cimex lectularius]|uniref:PID domain-containing protein n=1 Tax=Cimex lectularius TaxID=79782 RepID=A0A8I6SPL3_CIMLE|nr:uncharacterized protein LOC106661175 [Cimex lectularius]